MLAHMEAVISASRTRYNMCLYEEMLLLVPFPAHALFEKLFEQR
jgi:hypothetical protein